MNDWNKNKKIIALQAQVHKESKEISSFPSSKECGSATVEAAMVLPIFLCAICTLCVIGQFFLAECSIYHATMQTARVYAKQETALSSRLPKTSKLAQTLAVNVIFHQYVEGKDVDSAYVLGGKNGVVLTTSHDDDYCSVNARYILKVPVPFFKGIMLNRSVQVKCRLFTGYVPMNDKSKDSGQNDQVYVTKTGNVYHTSLNCYHLSISISDQDQIKKIMGSSHYKKCKKCMSSGSQPTSVYHTKEGDCYHSSLECSGLKREISMVSKENVSGMRMCSECAKH